MALRGPTILLPLTSAALFQDDASAFAERVTLRSDAEFDARFPAETLARVPATPAATLPSSVTSPRGAAAAPLGWPELEDKLLAASRFVASAAQQALVIDAMQAARTRDFAPLDRLLATLHLASPPP